MQNYGLNASADWAVIKPAIKGGFDCGFFWLTAKLVGISKAALFFGHKKPTVAMRFFYYRRAVGFVSIYAI